MLLLYTKLTRKGVRWNWDGNCEESYQQLCCALSQNPVTLAYPDWSKAFHLEVDASDVAIGGVLAQEDIGGKLRPISFFTSTLDAAQIKYSIGEKEAWAIVAAACRFSKYLQAAKQVIISSDHNPLVWLRQKRDPRGKFARWLLELEGLNYIVRYRRGIDNLAADYLSRSATEYDTEVNNEIENLERKVYIVRDANEIHRMDDTEKGATRNEGIIIELESGSFREELKSGQASDPVTARAIEQLRKKGCISHGRFKKFKGMKLEEGILYRSRRVIIPASMSNRVIQTIHENFSLGSPENFRND